MLFVFVDQECPKMFGECGYVTVSGLWICCFSRKGIIRFFSLKFGVQQGSVLKSTVVVVMNVLTDEVRNESLMELLYPYNLTLREEALDEIMEKWERWKKVLVGKGLWVNVEKTKGMQLFYSKKTCVKNVDPCGNCGEWVSKLYLVFKISEVVSSLLFRCVVHYLQKKS